MLILMYNRSTWPYDSTYALKARVVASPFVGDDRIKQDARLPVEFVDAHLLVQLVARTFRLSSRIAFYSKDLGF